MYTFQSRVRYSELDHYKDSMSLSSIINYFQDCSTFQSEDSNIGLTYLQERNRVWLLNSWQVLIHRPITLGDNITIGTWPSRFDGFYGYRNFIMKDKNDDILAVANSIWIYLDTLTGMPCKVNDDFNGYVLEPPYPMETEERKVQFPKNLESHDPFPVLPSNIDSYHHVNNGQYIKMAEEYLPKDFIVTKMRVEYRKQAILGDMIFPLLHRDQNQIYVVLANQEQKPFAIIEFTGKSLT